MNTFPYVSGPFARLPLGLPCPYFEGRMTAFLETGVLGQRAFRSGCAEQSSEDDSGREWKPCEGTVPLCEV